MSQSFLLMIQRNGTMFFLSKFWCISRRHGSPQHTNWHNTKIQNIGTRDAPRAVHIDNQAVETVSRFTYFIGLWYRLRVSDGYSYPEIHRRLGIAGSIKTQLDNVWRQQRLSLSTKLRINIHLSCAVCSVMYGSETWTMRKVDSDRIQSFHMQTLHRILGIRWYDKVSNAEVNERTKLLDVPSLSLIADRRHSLFGHICHLYRRTHLLRRHCNCQ